jgi:hypothetical protein
MAALATESAGLTRDVANARRGSRERIAHLLCAPSDAQDMAPAWMGSACVTLVGTVMIVQTKIAPATARDTAPVRLMELAHARRDSEVRPVSLNCAQSRTARAMERAKMRPAFVTEATWGSGAKM